MSIADKQVLLNRLSHDFGDELTANQLTVIMSKLAVNMSAFDISRECSC